MTSGSQAAIDFFDRAELAAAWASQTALFLWRRGERRVAWGNAAALALWQVRSLAELTGETDALSHHPAFKQIDQLAYRLDAHAVQLERLRFYLAGRDINLLCRCEWRHVGLSRLLQITAMQALPELQPVKDIATHARLVLRNQGGAHAALSAAGEILFATPAMQALIDGDEATVTAQLRSAAHSAKSGEDAVRLSVGGVARQLAAAAIHLQDQQLAIVTLLPVERERRLVGVDALIDRLQLRMRSGAQEEEAVAAEGDAPPVVSADNESDGAVTCETDEQDEVNAPMPADTVPFGEDGTDVPPAAPEEPAVEFADEPEQSEQQDEPTAPAQPAISASPPQAPALHPVSGSPNVFRLASATSKISELPQLQSNEHAAFRELARALGARLESDIEQSAAAAQSGEPAEIAETDDEPAASLPGASEIMALIDRIPIALLVFTNNQPVFANRAMLDMFRFAGARQLQALPSISGLLPQLSSETGLYPARLVARRNDGEVFHVIARLRAISWRGERAMLLSMREPQQEADEQATAGEAQSENRQTGSSAHPETRTEVPVKPDAARRGALELAADAALLVARDGRILEVLGGEAFLAGVAASDLTGTRFVDLFLPESRAQAEDYLDGLRRHGVARLLGDSRDLMLAGAQGSTVDARLKMTALGEGGEQRFIAVLHDVSDWKRQEQALRTARKEAQESSSQKSEFLARVSHEIRTPLNSIIGFSELMIEEGLPGIENERYRDYLRDIHDSGKMLLGIVNDLLDLSKIEAGKLELDFVALDLNEAMRLALATMQPQAGRGKIILRSSGASDLPAVVADRRSLQQILLNLLSNAIKFTEPGGQVIVSTGPGEDGGVELRVRDTGIGMDEEQLAAALEPFRQVPRTLPAREPGTGLGLPLTRALVEANRALFDIQSTPGVGTLVRVVFPRPRVLDT